MLTILNRLRGTWAIMAKVTGVVLGIAFYIATGEVYMSAMITIGYILGESMGWGKWIGGIISGHRGPATAQQQAEKEGTNNGIHWIANRIAPQTVNFYRYSQVALFIRGFYWWAITLFPLTYAGFMPAGEWILASVLVGAGFPISVMIGVKTEKEFKLKMMESAWTQAEVWYGFIQDIFIISIIISIFNR